MTVIAATLVAVALHLLAQASMMWFRADWSPAAFRNYFASDQLSYLGIVAAAAGGQFDAVEPFTETGTIHYPRAYYLLLGAVSGAFGITPAMAWYLVGISLQCVLVAVLALTVVRLTGHPWTAVLAAGPFLLGTFSTLVTTGWYTALDSHAVLWGAFGVLFTLNAESAALCLGGIALLLLLMVWARPTGVRTRIVVSLLAAALIGALANMQTYSFLSTVYVTCFVLAAFSLLRERKPWLTLVSLGLVVVLFLVGPVLADRVSPLLVLFLGLLPALPGIVLLMVRMPVVIAMFAVAGATASPSVLGTLLGLIAGDPFLVYRVASSKNLGVPLDQGLIAAIVLLVPLAVIAAAGLRRRRLLWVAYPVGVVAAWALTMVNDVWGANQEPYRFWIDSFFLTAATILPLLAMVVGEYLAPSRAAVPPRVPVPSRREVGVAIGAFALVAVLAVVSIQDWAKFYSEVGQAGLLHFDTPRDVAVAEAARSSDGGLILTDPCIDPLYAKIVSYEPIVYMNYGMAWPEEYQAVLDLGTARGEGVLDERAAEAADVRWVLTDSGCEADWAAMYSDQLDEADSASFGAGTITLWAFVPEG